MANTFFDALLSYSNSVLVEFFTTIIALDTALEYPVLILLLYQIFFKLMNNLALSNSWCEIVLDTYKQV